MSNYNSLKTTIDANIKQNGNQEITGQILNSVLNQMVTTLGAGYQFAGVATTATNPGSPDAKVFYIANGKGTYEKFGGINVTEDDVVVLYWDSSWHKVSTGIASDQKLSELDLQVDAVSGIVLGYESIHDNLTSSIISSEGKQFNANLDEVSSGNASDVAQKIDVSEYAGKNVIATFFTSQRNKSGFKFKDGSVILLEDVTGYYAKREVIIPTNAQYLCITFFKGFGEQNVTVDRDNKKGSEERISELENNVTIISANNDERKYHAETTQAKDTVWLNCPIKAGQKAYFDCSGDAYGYKIVGKKEDGSVVDITTRFMFERITQKFIEFSDDYVDIGFYAQSVGKTLDLNIVNNYYVTKQLVEKVNSYSNFNDVEKNRDAIQLFHDMYVNKVVDKTNRLVVSFNGDSIIGSQLDNISKSEQYLTGDFPPNLSKMIMARKFFDKYRFEGEDVKFRNLIHSDWTKVGFDINKGKDSPSLTFNEIEVYGAHEGDYAQIATNGYKYIKFVWSEYGDTALPYSFDIMRSENNGDFTKIDSISNDGNRRLMVAYKIYTIDPTKNYVYKIVPTSGHANVKFWGCEMWNNPRLDVVVQAYSGSTAKFQASYNLDGYHSVMHTPALIISDVLVLNDSSFIAGSNDTINDWMSSNAKLYQQAKDGNIPMLMFNYVKESNEGIKMLDSSLVKVYGLPIIDMKKKIVHPNYAKSVNKMLGPDGLHLSDAGNIYYFEELERIFDGWLISPSLVE